MAVELDLDKQIKANLVANGLKATKKGVPMEQIVDLTGIGVQPLEILARQGVLVRVARGRYDLRMSMRRYCAYMREMAAGRLGTKVVGGISMAEESAKLKKALREREELKTEELRGTLVTIGQFESVITGFFGLFRRTMIALSPRIATAAHLTIAQDEKTKTIIYGALKDIANDDVLAGTGLKFEGRK